MLTITDLQYVSNHFFEAFSFEAEGIGKITLGYFDAFKSIDTLVPTQKLETLGSLNSLFSGSSIVAGDLNSTPAKIRGALKGTLKSDARVLGGPSYLFPLEEPDPKQKYTIPSFDNFVVSDPEISAEIHPTVKLPTHVTVNPRELMRRLSLPSDHVPMKGKFTKDDKSLNIAIYNIADPVFWGELYPDAAMGFDISETGETMRQQLLADAITALIENNDIVFLSEVPETFLASLEKIVLVTSKKIEKRRMLQTETDLNKLNIVSKNQPQNISSICLIY